MKSTRMAKTAAAVTLAGVLAVCASSVSSAAGSTKAVTISVASLIPGSTPAAKAQFDSQVKEFEKANPSIKVTPVEYQWLGRTFAGKLARRQPPAGVGGAV